MTSLTEGDCQKRRSPFYASPEPLEFWQTMPDGRLKRREAVGEPIEWVFYHRPNRVSPKMSNYTILTDEQARRRWGTQSLKEWLRVIKTRELWMIEDVVSLEEKHGRPVRSSSRMMPTE